MYTEVKELNNKLYLTNVKEGVVSYKIIEDFKPKLYVHNTDGNPSSNFLSFPYNKPLDVLDFESVKEYKDYTYDTKEFKNDYFGGVPAQYQYIQKHFSKSKIEKCRTHFMDIETNVEDEFPDPETTPEPITFIQVYDNIDEEIHIFHWKRPYKFDLESDVIDHKFDSEKEMLNAWLNYYFDKKPQTVCGINFVSFDTRYLTNRLNLLGYEKNILSPFSKSTKENYKSIAGDITVNYPVGVSWMSWDDIFYTHAYIKTPNKKLESIASTVLNLDTAKLNWKLYFKSFKDMTDFNYQPPEKFFDEGLKEEPIYKLWEKIQKTEDFNERYKLEEKLKDLAYKVFYDYSVIDVRLLKELDEKLQLMNLAYSFAWSMGVNICDVLGTVKPWTMNLYDCLQEENYQIPASIPEHDKYKPVGGLWASNPGLYIWIMSQDYTSLYPLNDTSLNMSPETIIHIDDIPEDLKEELKPLLRYEGILPKKKKSDPDEWGWIDRPNSQDIYRKFSVEKKEKIRDLAKKYNYSVAINGVCFSNDKEGVLCKVIMNIFKSRKEKQGKMRKHESLANDIKTELNRRKEDGVISNFKEVETTELTKMLNENLNLAGIYKIQQQVEKIKINALYGALSNKHFPLCVSDIASAITSLGRFMLESLADTGIDLIKRVTGEDAIITNKATDAIYIVLEPIVRKKFGDNIPDDKTVAKFLDKFNKTVFAPAINKMIEDNLGMLNAYKNYMGCDREIIASKGLVTGISRYALRVIDDEGKLLDKPKMKIVGMPNINMTIPPKIRKALDDVINIIFDEDNITLTSYIDKFKNNMKKSGKDVDELSISDISIQVGVNNLDSQSYYASVASRIHNKVIDRLKLNEEFEKIKSGDKVMLCHLIQNPITPASTIAFTEDKFLERTGLIDYVNYNEHYEKMFMANVEVLTKTIGWNTNSNSLVFNELF